MLNHIFLTILQMSLTATVVILVVLAMRCLLKKMPKIFSYALWLIVLFRLLCPIAVESSFGIPNSIYNFIVATETRQNQSQIDQYVASTNEMDYEQQSLIPNVTGNNTIKNANEQWEATDSREKMIVGNHPAWSHILGISKYIWFCVVIGLLLYSMVSFFRLKKKLAASKPVENNVYEMVNLPTPFVFGVFHPNIYLPTGIVGEEREYILAHERMHLKRFDYLIKMTTFLVVIIHWFNPLVWLSFFCMTKDMEMSCDEAVISKYGSKIKKEYSSSLLHMAAWKSELGITPLAFGEQNVKGRIQNILHYKKAGIGILILCASILMGTVAILTTNQSAPKSEMKIIRSEDSVNSNVLQKFKLTDEVKSYMFFAVTFQDGREIERNLLAAENVLEDGREGERNISIEYSNNEGKHSVTTSVSDGANAQFQTFYLPGYSMRASSVLWDNERYHRIAPDTVYLLDTEYIGYGDTKEIQAYRCEDIMQNQTIWDEVMKQTQNSRINTLMIFYVPSVKTAEELVNDLEEIPLYTDTIELTTNNASLTQLEEMYQRRTQYIGDNPAIVHITNQWFVSDEVPLTKDGLELQTTTEPYELIIHYQSDEDALISFQTNAVYLERDAALFFALVENAGKVTVTINDEKMVSYTRVELEERYGDLWKSSENYDDFCKLYQYICHVQEKILSSSESEIMDLSALKQQAEKWAKAFCERDGDAILTMVSEETKQNLQDKELLMVAGNTASFGLSSPWPMQSENDYQITNMNIAEHTAEILFYAMTSDPHISVWQEKITFSQENEAFLITNEELNFMDSISTLEEYQTAYPGEVISGTQMDYTTNGLGEVLNSNALLSSSTVYRDLFSPDTALAFLLNLSDDRQKVQIVYESLEDDTGDVVANITFASTGETVVIRMTQPYGANGIWIPQDMAPERGDDLVR